MISRRVGALVAGVLLVAAGWVVLQDRPAPSPSAPTVRPAAPSSRGDRHEPRPAGSARLRLDRLDVDAAVVPVRARAGVLTPPADPATVGWWRAGARPGSRVGAVLMTGHAVHAGHGAFDHLGRARVGDRVSVRYADRAISYVVHEVQVLSRRQLAHRSDRLFALDGPARLVLVTCEDWNGKAYDANVVVVARMG